MDLAGRTVLVTGGSNGIGRTLAEAFAARGAAVALSSRALERAEAVANAIRGRGGRALAVEADVRNKSQVQAAVAHVEETLGPIDVLINNAGVAGAGASETLPEEDWDRIVDTNLKGAFLCAQAVGRRMLERRSGRIVNIASVAGIGGFPKRAAYGSSKAALIMLTKVLAVEWADRNVQVNAIAPGVVRTDLNDEMIAKGFLDRAAIERRTPMHRRGETGEMVGAVMFLVSDDASYVTGACLTVDGGWTAYGFL
jgi:NAD(P)-dependent dehydrogenase (short-subunit alcohol dehydrogenase family)